MWHGCVVNIAMFGIAMLVFIVAFPAAACVHVNAPQWETLAVFVSLGLSILPALWYWRVKRHGWAASVLAGLFLTFGFSAALFHGWETQAAALVTVAIVLGSVIVFIGMTRAIRRLAVAMETSMRAAGEELNGDPLFRRAVLFRDDGQRITVYPRRRRLVFACLAQGVILAGIACVFAFVRTADLRIWISLGLVACVLFPIFLATLYRLLIRKASLEIGPDGIFDSGSLLWSGVGLIRWDEILAVFPTTRSSGRVKQHFLDIMVTDLPEIRKRLPLLKRLALSSTYSRMSQVLIGQSLLATPVDDLAQQVDQYVATHAPPGWRDRAAEGSVDHQLDDNDAGSQEDHG
jgi:hypothetical protein